MRALELYEQVRAAGPAMTAQTFERLYLQLLERRNAHGDPAQREWLYAYRLACDVFQALVWAWRFGLRGRPSIIGSPRAADAGSCPDASNGRP